MSGLINPSGLQARIGGILNKLCGGRVSYLRHTTRTIANHVQTATSVTNYPVSAVLDKTHQIESPTGEKIILQTVYCSANTTPPIPSIPNDPGIEWQFVDASGNISAIKSAYPTRPLDSTTVLYQLDIIK